MADPVFLARLLGASLVAMVLLLGAGNGVGPAQPAGHSASYSR
jgi:hypothetical protein